MNPRTAVRIRGLSIKSISRLMGVSQSYVSLLVNGQRRWTPILQKLFCGAVGILPSEIEFPEDVEKPG